MIRSLVSGRRRVLVVAVLFALLGTALITIRARPASAYTVEYVNSRIIRVHSARLHDQTVRATIHVEIYRSGSYWWWAEVHNSGRVSKLIELKGSIKFASIYASLPIDSGRYETAPGYRTKEGEQKVSHLVRDHWADLEAGFQAEFSLDNHALF